MLLSGFPASVPRPSAPGRAVLRALVPAALLGVALLVPNCFTMWAVGRSYGAMQDASEAARLPDTLANVRHDVSLGEFAARDLLEHAGAGQTADVARILDGVQAEMARLRAAGHLIAPGRIARLEQDHARYVAAWQAVMLARGQGGAAAAITLRRERAGPAFRLISDDIAAAMSDAFEQEGKLAAQQAAGERAILLGTPLVMLLDTGLWLAYVITARRARERGRRAARREVETTRRSERRLQALLQNMSDTILILGSDGTIAFQGAAGQGGCGAGEQCWLGRRLHDVADASDAEALDGVLGQSLHAPLKARAIEFHMRTQAGEMRRAELTLVNLLGDPAVAGIAATIRDIEEKKRFDELLTRQAFFDNLTGLANRPLLQDRLAQALSRSVRQGRRVGVIFIDLDNFKLINDGLGHEAGDRLLVSVAERLSACGRREDTVARLGGDEFVVLVDVAPATQDEARVAETFAACFGPAFSLAGRTLSVTASIGVAFGDAATETPDSLMRNADIAMYRAKQAGKGRCVLFDLQMFEDSLGRLELEHDLRAANFDSDFRLHYQPIVDMQTGRITEVEALVRWQHPVRGLISPADFIPIAEETGVIVPLGDWVLAQACRQAMEWRCMRIGAADLTLSVNISPKQLHQTDLPGVVQTTLEDTGLPAASLKLEITEGVILRDVAQTIEALQRLKALGVKLALDDFGTGYSSLSYLKRLPLDVLKIDRSFIRGIDENDGDAAIVKTIIALAKSLNLSVTGEGIETSAQAAMLREMKCELGQGYYFARPLESWELAMLLRSCWQARLEEGAPQVIGSASSLALAAL